MISATYKADVTKSGVTIHMSNINADGDSNCQGISRDYVLSHFKKDMKFVLVGDRLRDILPNGGYAEFVRVDPSKK
jgi:hypothetical protein